MKNPKPVAEKTCVESGHACVLDRVDELRTWASYRIAECRRHEAKFGATGIGIEASHERRTLEAVIRILDG